MFAKFDEIPSMILQDIKETKRYGHTFGRSDVRTDGRTDNVKNEALSSWLKLDGCLLLDPP